MNWFMFHCGMMEAWIIICTCRQHSLLVFIFTNCIRTWKLLLIKHNCTKDEELFDFEKLHCKMFYCLCGKISEIKCVHDKKKEYIHTTKVSPFSSEVLLLMKMVLLYEAQSPSTVFQRIYFGNEVTLTHNYKFFVC